MTEVGTSPEERSLKQRLASPFSIVTMLISIFVLALIVYPMGRMLARALGGVRPDDWLTLAGEPWFGPMLRDTIVTVGAGAIFAIVMAGVIAWINERTDAGIGVFGDVLPLVPLFLPNVAMAIGWGLLANPNVGFINALLEVVLDPLGLTYSFNIYSRPGLAFVYGLTFLPYAYLPIAAGLKTSNPSLEEAARTSGATPIQVLRTISLPAIRPAIVAATVLVTIVGLGLYSVPTIIGTRAEIDILSVRIIRAIRNEYPPQFDTAVMLSVFLFAILAALWVVQRNTIRGGHFGQISGKSEGRSVLKLGGWRWPLRLVLIGYIVLAAVLPVVALGIVSFQSFWQANVFVSTWTTGHYEQLLFGYPVARRSIENSLLLGFVAGGITVLMAGVIMLYVHRHSTSSSRFADAVVKTPAAVPNTVIAVAFVFALAGPPFGLGGTLLILALGYLVVYIPYAAITAEVSITQIHPSMREASYMCGASEGRTFRSIVAPLMVPGLFAAWALVFVRILGDLAIAVLLGTGRTPVIGFILLDTWDQGIFGRVAALALMMTALTTPIVLAMLWLGTPRYRRKVKT